MDVMADVFTKRRPDAPRGLFAAEAAGLRWLRVPGGARVVDVVDVAEHSIVLARVPIIAPTRAAAAEFGAALAVTHDAGAAAFGAGPDGYDGPSFIADLPMPTEPAPTWGEFFATQRVLPFVRLGRHALGPDGVHILERLAERLAAGVFDDDAPPARLHGDLWAGNVLFAPDGVTLIDPSAHGGHRISDLAMLALFGAPYLDAIFAAYADASAHLPDGWRELIGLHQVYPLLVHTVLFGGGYARQAVDAARPYVR